VWDGYIGKRGGYATITRHGGPLLAHRVAYEIANGPIPTDKEIDHLCRVRCCINPDHLEAVTRSTNLIRGIGPGIWSKRMLALNEERRANLPTHCSRGHEYTAENTLTYEGHRRCRTCKNATSAAGYHRRKIRAG